MTDADAPPRRSTGVEILDRTLGGGIPAGSLVALCADADSQSHLLLTAAAAAAPTTYFTTYRPPRAVETGSHADVQSLDADSLDDDPDRLAAAVPQDGYVVVDRLNDVEAIGPETLRDALNALADACREQNAVGLLHCPGDGDTPERSLALARADLVMRLIRTVTSLTVDYRLVVSKFRGGRAPTEPIKIRLTDHVAVDTSRDIA